MSNIIIIRKAFDKELDQVYDLRWKILRKPWNQPRGSEKDEIEEDAISFVALIEDEIIATARLHGNSEEEAQIRYLAVDEKHQGEGTGSKLIRYIEWYASRLGHDYVILYARKAQTSFFERLDYEKVGEGPTVFGEIEHVVMKKKLMK